MGDRQRYGENTEHEEMGLRVQHGTETGPQSKGWSPATGSLRLEEQQGQTSGNKGLLPASEPSSLRISRFVFLHLGGRSPERSKAPRGPRVPTLPRGTPGRRGVAGRAGGGSGGACAPPARRGAAPGAGAGSAGADGAGGGGRHVGSGGRRGSKVSAGPGRAALAATRGEWVPSREPPFAVIPGAGGRSPVRRSAAARGRGARGGPRPRPSGATGPRRAQPLCFLPGPRAVRTGGGKEGGRGAAPRPRCHVSAAARRRPAGLEVPAGRGEAAASCAAPGAAAPPEPRGGGRSASLCSPETSPCWGRAARPPVLSVSLRCSASGCFPRNFLSVFTRS